MEALVENPIKRVDTEVVDDAFKVLIEMLNELSNKRNLSESEVDYIIDLIKEAYQKRKASLYINSFTQEASEYFDHAFRFALNKESKDSTLNEYTKMFYLRSRKNVFISDR